MAEHSSIEWTDATWNPITGCQVVSPGCTNCYAMRLAGTRLKHHHSRIGLTLDTKAGPVWNGQVRFNAEWLTQPLTWKKPRRIFVCAHGDLFAEGVPIEWIEFVYAVAVAAVHLRGHTLQILTKRADKAREILSSEDFWEQVNSLAAAYIMEAVDPLNRRSDDARATIRDYGPKDPPPGIWLGVSAEDQRRADERIPALLDTPAAVRFVSLEPLLGPIDLRRIHYPSIKYETGDHYQDVLSAGSWSARMFFRPSQPGEPQRYFTNHSDTNRLDWVILGGESGPGARPMHPDWARQIRDACGFAGTPLFFKQWGAWAPVADHLPRVELAGASPGCPPNVAWPDGTICWGDAADHGGPGVFLSDIGKKTAGRLLDGVEHSAMPAGA